MAGDERRQAADQRIVLIVYLIVFMKDSFVFRKEWRDAICELPAKVRAEVYVAIIEYGLTGETPQLKSMARMAFNFVKTEIDRETAELERKRDRSERMRGVAMNRWQKGVAGEEPLQCSDAQEPTHMQTHMPTNADAYAQKSSSHTYIKNKYKEESNIYNNINLKDNNIKKERESRKREKEPEAAPNALQRRKEDFYNSLVPFVARYGRETIRAFFDYWSEPNRSATKMRCELERTWQTARRLAVWASRERDFKTRDNGTGRGTGQEQARQRTDDALAIMRELKGSSGQVEDH